MIDASSDKARGMKRIKISMEDMGWVEVYEKRGKRKEENRWQGKIVFDLFKNPIVPR